MRLNKNVRGNVITVMLVAAILCTACQKEADNTAAESITAQESSVVNETVSKTEASESSELEMESASLYGKIGKITDSSFTLKEVDYESGEVTGEKDLILEEGTEYTIFKLKTAESEDMEEIAGTKADLKEGAEVTCGYKLDGDKYVAVKIYITQIG